MADAIAWLHHAGRPARWANLGLWQHGHGKAEPEQDYADACEALALAVGRAAGIQAGDSVLSLGCGSGEELALWTERFGAARVMGLELAPALAAQARRRGESVHASCEVEVHCADARLLARLVRGRFDRIVCVDAIHHLGARAPLFRAARTRLFGGGAFAFTDFVLERGARPRRDIDWRALALRLGSRLAGVAQREVQGTAATLAQLREAGFDGTAVTPLADAVLDGFCAFAERQARRIGAAARLSPAWRRVALAAWLLRAGRAVGLGYALYSARLNVGPDTGDTDEERAASAAAHTLPIGAPTQPHVAAIARASASGERPAPASSALPAPE